MASRVVGRFQRVDLASAVAVAAPIWRRWAAGCDNIGRGALAQLVEHLLCKQGVRGSSPLCSTPSLLVRAIWWPSRSTISRYGALLAPFESASAKPYAGSSGGLPHRYLGVTPNLDDAAEWLEAHAAELERTATEFRQQAAELRIAEPAKPLPALIAIKDAAERYGLSEWAVRKLLADGVLS